MSKKILTSKQHLFINNYISNNFNGAKAARDAGYKGNNNQLANMARANLLKPYIAEEIKRRKADIELSTKIDIVTLQRKLMFIVDDIVNIEDDQERRKLYHKVVPAVNSLLKTLGGFKADEIPDKNLIGKALDAKKVEEMRRFYEAYYAHKYLAKPVETTEIPTENTDQSNTLHQDSMGFTDTFQGESTEHDFSQSEPDAPQGGGA